MKIKNDSDEEKAEDSSNQYESDFEEEEEEKEADNQGNTQKAESNKNEEVVEEMETDTKETVEPDSKSNIEKLEDGPSRSKEIGGCNGLKETKSNGLNNSKEPIEEQKSEPFDEKLLSDPEFLSDESLSLQEKKPNIEISSRDSKDLSEDSLETDFDESELEFEEKSPKMGKIQAKKNSNRTSQPSSQGKTQQKEQKSVSNSKEKIMIDEELLKEYNKLTQPTFWRKVQEEIIFLENRVKAKKKVTKEIKEKLARVDKKGAAVYLKEDSRDKQFIAYNQLCKEISLAQKAFKAHGSALAFNKTLKRLSSSRFFGKTGTRLRSLRKREEFREYLSELKHFSEKLTSWNEKARFIYKIIPRQREKMEKLEAQLNDLKETLGFVSLMRDDLPWEAMESMMEQEKEPFKRGSRHIGDK